MDEFSGVGIRNTTSDSNHRPGSGNHMSATETRAAGDCLLHPYQIHSSDMELNIVQVNMSSSVAAGNESDGYNSEDPSYKLIEMISVGVVLGLIDLTTVLGNLLVCVTIASVRRLHSVTNFLIFSLAVCDLLLGCLVLPFSVLNTILPDAWPLGSIFCNLFVSTDVMLCTVSILTLLVISLDRYLAIVMPFRYCRYTACRWRYCSILSIVWLFSFAMAFVPIHFGWNTETGLVQNFDNPDRCEFKANAAYVPPGRHRDLLLPARHTLHGLRPRPGCGQAPGPPDPQGHGHVQQQQRRTSTGRQGIHVQRFTTFARSLQRDQGDDHSRFGRSRVHDLLGSLLRPLHGSAVRRGRLQRHARPVHTLARLRQFHA